MSTTDQSTRQDHSDAATARRFRPMLSQLLRDSGYVLGTLPFAIASFTVIVTGLSMAVSMTIIWIGIPIGVATLYAGHGLAIFERKRLRAQGTVLNPVHLRPRHGNIWQRLLRPLSDPTLWREALHGILALPVMILTWTVTLTWWALVVGGLTGWIWERFQYSDSGSGALMRLLHWPISGEVFDLIVGLIALVTLPGVVHLCALAHIGLAKALLNPTHASLRHRVAELSQARDKLSQAEANALRRLERDLHDGPQQTLIRLGMDLSACERRLSKGDMASAMSLLQGARHLTETVIAELRALSRSIAPPVLAERGLKAALLEASAHCPMPVRLQYDLSQEPPQATAIAAYYVTCEALANAVKHSSASHVAVSVTPDGDNHLVVKISDDGIGGAVSVPGHGLAGLADRVAALDGHLTVTGTPGTTLTAILPMRQDLR